VLSERGLQRRIRLRCRNYLAAFHVVSETDLVLTMPERYAGVLNAGFANRILPLPLATPTIDLYLYWHAAVDQDPANRWLRELLQRMFAGYSRGAMKSGQIPHSAASAAPSRPRQKPSSIKSAR